ncbi:MAG: heme o synthase [Candidatus Geothermarchaeales archaeon]
MWPYVELAKPRIILLLNHVAVASLFVASRGLFSIQTLVALLVAGSLASYASSAFNAYIDRDIDALVSRTRDRPLPSGRIVNPLRVVYFAVALTAAAAGVSLAFLNLAATGFILLGVFVYVFVYTLWLKRRTPWNIVIGGGAGSFAALAGWASAGLEVGLAAWLMAILVLLWTPSHFWSLALRAKADYAKTDVPMLPVVIGDEATARVIAINTIVLIGFSLLLPLAGVFGLIYLVTTLIATIVFLTPTVLLLRRPSPESAWRAFKISSPYLAIVFLAMALDAFLA